MAVLEEAPAKPAIFASVAQYGWLTILIGGIAMAATYPGRTHGLGMVTELLLKDFGLTDPDGRVFYSVLNFWGTLLGSLFCLPVGWMMDRWDRRLVLAGNLILLGTAVHWMSSAQTWPALFAGIVLTRGLGQSALSVVSITLVSQSFRASQLGLAMAWYSILSAPFHLLFIKWVGWALKGTATLVADTMAERLFLSAIGWSLNESGHDWRSIWSAVGLALILTSLLAALVGRKATAIEAAGEPASHEGATLRQALATPAFWVFGLTISLWGMVYSGVALFNEDIFKERGFGRDLYFDVLALVTVVALIAKLAFGWLVKHVPLTRLLALCLLTTAGCLAGLPQATQTWHVYLYGVGMGIASGSVALLFFATWGRLYGRRDLGRIQGVAQMLTVFASASGPLIFSTGKRLTASYASVFHILSLAVLAMAVAAWLTPLPRFVEDEDHRQ